MNSCMKMEVETISTSYVKPSSPTPPHLKTYHLSGIDQINLPIYFPVFLIFTADPTRKQPDHDDRRLLLKQSLSNTLSRYYPLAGRFADSLSVDCCDSGAYYSEVKIVNSSLTEVLRRPDNALFRRILPMEALKGGRIYSPPLPGSPIVLVQVTDFPCGGFAIGLLSAHRVLDASSVSSFLLDWAAASAAGECAEVVPNFGASSLFPQNEAIEDLGFVAAAGEEAEIAAPVTPPVKKREVLRRFVFQGPALTSLKEKLAESMGWSGTHMHAGGSIGMKMSPPPSRVQAVTAILCSSILRSFQTTYKDPTPTTRPVVVTQAVNIRRRADPPLPSNSIGNYVVNSVTSLPPTTDARDLAHLAKLLGDSVSNMDGEFVKGLQGEEGKSRLTRVKKREDDAMAGSWRRVCFTSWSRLGYYDVDFGSGRPAWMGCSVKEEKESSGVFVLVMIMDHVRDGSGGLEAWVTLPQDEMALLEDDELLLSFASLDPSPLLI